MNKAAATKEFLEALADPRGAVRRAAYRSFRKGQEAEAALVAELAAKHGVDPQVLVDAELNERARILCGAGPNKL